MRCGPECSSYSLGLVTSPPWASASLCLQLRRKKKLILSDGILHWYFYDALVLWNYTTLLYHSYPWNLPKYPIIHRMKSKSLSIQESPVHFGLHLPLTHVPRQQCTPPIQICFFTSKSQTYTSLFLLLPSLECASCSFFFTWWSLIYLPRSPNAISSLKVSLLPWQGYLQSSLSSCLVWTISAPGPESGVMMMCVCVYPCWLRCKLPKGEDLVFFISIDSVPSSGLGLHK